MRGVGASAAVCGGVTVDDQDRVAVVQKFVAQIVLSQLRAFVNAVGLVSNELALVAHLDDRQGDEGLAVLDRLCGVRQREAGEAECGIGVVRHGVRSRFGV